MLICMVLINLEPNQVVAFSLRFLLPIVIGTRYSIEGGLFTGRGRSPGTKSDKKPVPKATRLKRQKSWCMENEIRTWLADIKQAIEEIDFFLPGKNDFFEFRNDLKTQRAIERNVEIIGEAIMS